jgi:DNA-binding MarR family transcriptional regulator
VEIADHIDHCFKALVALGEGELIDRMKHEILNFNETLNNRVFNIYDFEKSIDAYKNDMQNRNKILNYIHTNPRCVQKNICKDLLLNSKKAKYIIDWLEKMSIIYRKKNGNSFLLSIIDITDQIAKFGKNECLEEYEIQNPTIKDQTIARRNIEKFTELHGKNEDIQNILRNAREAWPDNYEMQLRIIHNELLAFREIKELIQTHEEDENIHEIFLQARNTWTDDFEMQLRTINKELSAFREIKELVEAYRENEDIQNILRNAKEDWPDDYEMQLSTINDQIFAYRGILIETFGDDNEDIQNILQNAKEDWPDDYEMQLSTIKDQLSAYREIKELIETHGENEDIHAILLQAREDWPDDYEMQLRELNDSCRDT